jgi:hypothetical protein
MMHAAFSVRRLLNPDEKAVSHEALATTLHDSHSKIGQLPESFMVGSEL